MNRAPHFVLFSRIGEQTSQDGMQGGSWHFRLVPKSGGSSLEASDLEADISTARLELLAVVRGLEALDGPSRVTLVTSNRQITRAVRQGLEYWRQRDWKWERFGEKVPMKNADLWQRIDHAMQIHDVDCRWIRIDPPQPGSTPHVRSATHDAKQAKHVKRTKRPTPLPLVPLVSVARWMAQSMHGTANALQRFLPDHSPNPHPMM